MGLLAESLDATGKDSAMRVVRGGYGCGARLRTAAWTLAVALCVGSGGRAGEVVVRSDKANAVAFPAQAAKFVRFVIHANTGEQPCIDELEVYGPDGKRNLALAKHGAKPSASSSLLGYPIHQIEHLNDGLYGNDHSWIAGTGNSGEWAQIELPKPAKVARVVFSRDRRD